jgi:hypothetical protein
MPLFDLLMLIFRGKQGIVLKNVVKSETFADLTTCLPSLGQPPYCFPHNSPGLIQNYKFRDKEIIYHRKTQCRIAGFS